MYTVCVCGTVEDVRCYLILALGYAMAVFGLVYFEPVQYWSGIQIDWMFWARGIGMVGSMLFISSCLGHRVVTRGLKVGYARKICHFLIHSLPALFTVTLPSYEVRLSNNQIMSRSLNPPTVSQSRLLAFEHHHNQSTHWTIA